MPNYKQHNLNSYTLEEVISLEIKASEVPADTLVVPAAVIYPCMEKLTDQVKDLEEELEELTVSSELLKSKFEEELIKLKRKKG